MSPNGEAPVIDQTVSLIADAELKFGFVTGTGLGALLLALVAVVFILRPTSALERFAAILDALRLPK